MILSCSQVRLTKWKWRWMLSPNFCQFIWCCWVHDWSKFSFWWAHFFPFSKIHMYPCLILGQLFSFLFQKKFNGLCSMPSFSICYTKPVFSSWNKTLLFPSKRSNRLLIPENSGKKTYPSSTFLWSSLINTRHQSKKKMKKECLHKVCQNMSQTSHQYFLSFPFRWAAWCFLFIFGK